MAMSAAPSNNKRPSSSMADLVTINVQTKPHKRFLALICQALFWIILVGAIAVSRAWLGGSFLVELLAAIFAIIVLVQAAARVTGKEVRMSVDEVRRWLDDGAPRDVLEWRAARHAKVVRTSGSGR
jgi:hypothetical protein